MTDEHFEVIPVGETIDGPGFRISAFGVFTDEPAFFANDPARTGKPMKITGEFIVRGDEVITDPP